MLSSPHDASATCHVGLRDREFHLSLHQRESESPAGRPEEDASAADLASTLRREDLSTGLNGVVTKLLRRVASWIVRPNPCIAVQEGDRSREAEMPTQEESTSERQGRVNTHALTRTHSHALARIR